MIYFVLGITIILFFVRVRTWKGKADAFDRAQFVKSSVSLPSMEDLIQSQEERRWQIVFHAFFNQLKEFIVWVKMKKRTI